MFYFNEWGLTFTELLVVYIRHCSGGSRMRSQLAPSLFSLVWFSGLRSGYILMNRLALLVQVLVYLNYRVFATQSYNLLRETVFLISRFQLYQQFELRHSNRFKILMITEVLRKNKVLEIPNILLSFLCYSRKHYKKPFNS